MTQPQQQSHSHQPPRRNQPHQAHQPTNSNGSGRRQRRKAKVIDLWRPVPPLPPVEPIVPGADATVLLRSLGDPPLHGQGAVAEHYLAAVVERAAGLATALAASADLLVQAPGD
jgi:hypothetical protein